MEDFPAESRPPLSTCLERLKDAEIYVLVIGQRYGSKPPRRNRSYTELEYDKAVQNGFKPFVFVMSDTHALLPGHYDTGDDALAVQRFRERVKKVHTVAHFDNSDHLATLVLASLLASLNAVSSAASIVDSRQRELDDISACFATFSSPLLKWRQTLPNGEWIDRPELAVLEKCISSSNGSSTALLGEAGSGKSALLARLCEFAPRKGFEVLAIKADFLPPSIDSVDAIGSLMRLPDRVDKCVAATVDVRPLLIVVDQLDAVCDLMDLKSGRLNAILELLRLCRNLPRVHVVCSCREFEFFHDVRLSALDAERLDLRLPEWHQVERQLESAGISNTSFWPEDFRKVLQVPHSLDVFLRRYRETRNAEVFKSYQEMLEDVWRRKLDTATKIDVVYDITAKLVEDEALWLPIARVESQMQTVEALQAAGILEITGSKVGFRHQTMLQHAIARLFSRRSESLVEHVLSRQHALFVRPMLWSTLSYLRAAAPTKYRQEIEHLFEEDLRLHLRYLLIDFLGHLSDPEEYEVAILSERLIHPDDQKRVLIAIRGRETWFQQLKTSHFPMVFRWPVRDLWPMIGIITEAWHFAASDCLELLDKYLLPYPENDEISRSCLREMHIWDAECVERVRKLVRRAPHGRQWWVEDLTSVISAAAPDLAPRVVAAALKRELDEVVLRANMLAMETKEEFGSESVVTGGQRASGKNPFEQQNSWYDLPGVAEAAPVAFLEELWPLFAEAARECYSDSSSSVLNEYGGWSFAFERERDEPVHYPIAHALEMSVKECARRVPEQFLQITRPSWDIERKPLQALLAIGLVEAAPMVPEEVLAFLCSDPRRLFLGSYYHSDQSYSCQLITAVSPHLSADQLKHLEQVVLSWSSYRADVEICDKQIEWDRESRHRLLKAIPPGMRSSAVVEMIGEEELPMQYGFKGRSRGTALREVPALTKDQMKGVSDQDILDAFVQGDASREAEWSEERQDLIRCGETRLLAHELGSLAKEDPDRVLRLLASLFANGYEAAIESILYGLVDSPIDGENVFTSIVQLTELGAGSESFRSSASHVLYRKCRAGKGLSDKLCRILECWLAEAWEENDDPIPIADESRSQDNPTSILWGSHRHVSVNGSFWTLLAITYGYLMRDPPDGSRWLAVLEKHLLSQSSRSVWQSYCSELHWIELKACDTPRGMTLIDTLFHKFPEIRTSDEGVRLIANLAHAMPLEMCQENLQLIRGSKWFKGPQAYGELLALIALRNDGKCWAMHRLYAELGLLTQGTGAATEGTVLGIAFVAAHLWDVPEYRKNACEVLCRIIPFANERLSQAVGTVFWASEDFPADELTTKLLTSIARNPSVVAGRFAADLVEHLVGLLPHCRRSILETCQAILKRRGSDVQSVSGDLFMCGPHLVNIAMTLQRFNDTREGGLEMFEELMRLGLDEAFKCLNEIDLRPIPSARRTPWTRRRRKAIPQQ
jgi:hypothetical protein